MAKRMKRKKNSRAKHTGVLSLRLPKETVRVLKRMARNRKISFAVFIRLILRQGIETHKMGYNIASTQR